MNNPMVHFMVVVGAWAEWGSTDADLGIRRQRRLARSLVTADLSHRLAVERKALGPRLCADLSCLDRCLKLAPRSLIDVMLHGKPPEGARPSLA